MNHYYSNLKITSFKPRANITFQTWLPLWVSLCLSNFLTCFISFLFLSFLILILLTFINISSTASVMDYSYLFDISFAFPAEFAFVCLIIPIIFIINFCWSGIFNFGTFCVREISQSARAPEQTRFFNFTHLNILWPFILFSYFFSSKNATLRLLTQSIKDFRNSPVRWGWSGLFWFFYWNSSSWYSNYVICWFYDSIFVLSWSKSCYKHKLLLVSFQYLVILIIENRGPSGIFSA